MTTGKRRLQYVDVMKGIAVLYIVFYPQERWWAVWYFCSLSWCFAGCGYGWEKNWRRNVGHSAKVITPEE